MSYFLTGDEFADDPCWEVLAGGKQQLIDALQASYQRLCAKTAHLRNDGYLTEQTAKRYVTSRRVLALLTTSVLNRAPKLHKRGDECECLGDDPWIDGFSYRIHRFLKRNPSRKEQDRNRAQKADLNDARLKAFVHERDGGCCRYCRSGELNKKSGRNKDRRRVLHFDHVDPDQPAGIDGKNFVTCCARCNEYKGHRLPQEADMRLLPEPTAEEIAAWKARGSAVFDLPLYQLGDQPPINAGSTPDQQTAADPITDPITDHPTDPITDRDDQSATEPDHEQVDHLQEQPASRPAKGPGRVGQPHSSDPSAGPPRHSPPQPPRSPDSPDIYHRRSRAPGTPTRTPHAPPEEASPS